MVGFIDYLKNSSSHAFQVVKRFKWFFISLPLIYLISLIYLLVIGLTVKTPIIVFTENVKTAIAGFQQKDLSSVELGINSAQNELTIIQKRYQFAAPLRYLPILGSYIADFDHVLVAAKAGLEAGKLTVDSIKPYADVLGFNNAETELNLQSAEEKIIFILQTLDKISPQLDLIAQKISEVELAVAKINPKRYPKTFKGKEFRQQLINLQFGLAASKDSLANIKPLLAILPKFLGESGTQKYLLLFQNDAELRPTGGFLTAYAVLEVYKGKITPVSTLDMYELDNRFGNRLPAPEPIKKYLPLVYSWHLRDMNLSPDFKVSMDTFFSNYKEVAPEKDLNGIIAVDTQLLVDLLDIIGEVGVADWGNYSSKIIPECNCPQVVYKMEDYSTRPTYYIKANRKGMIGPLMHTILLHVMNSPKKLWPKFVEIGLNNIKEKHLMFYFPDDPQLQQVSEAFNASGRVKDYQGDYFYLNDTNFAGAKSNLYASQNLHQEIAIKPDGSIIKTVTVEYFNPEPGDDCNLESGGLCLNGILRNWTRLYVPEGSRLIEVLGSDIGPTTSRDLGKTVFEAFIELRPQSKSKLIFKYELPYKHSVGQPYRMLIQKQPGTKNYKYTVSFGDLEKEFFLDQDKEIVF